MLKNGLALLWKWKDLHPSRKNWNGNLLALKCGSLLTEFCFKTCSFKFDIPNQTLRSAFPFSNFTDDLYSSWKLKSLTSSQIHSVECRSSPIDMGTIDIHVVRGDILWSAKIVLKVLNGNDIFIVYKYTLTMLLHTMNNKEIYLIQNS